MKTIKIASLTLSLSSLLATAACQSSESNLSDEDYDDVATAVGSMVANDSGGETGAMADGMAAAEGSLIADINGSVHVVIHGGLSYEYDVSCRDAAGTELDLCSALTTDSAEIDVSWSGELNLPNYQASVTRMGQWTFVDLQSDTAELDGTASFQLESHFQSILLGERDLELSYSAEYDAVLIDTETRRPVGGTIRYEIDGRRSVVKGDNSRELDVQVDAALTFAADNTATLVLDGEHSYLVNLDSGTVVAQGRGSVNL